MSTQKVAHVVIHLDANGSGTITVDGELVPKSFRLELFSDPNAGDGTRINISQFCTADIDVDGAIVKQIVICPQCRLDVDTANEAKRFIHETAARAIAEESEQPYPLTQAEKTQVQDRPWPSSGAMDE